MRLLHTMLRVGDLQRSIDFYTTVLGMQLLRKSENPEYKYTLAFVGFGSLWRDVHKCPYAQFPVMNSLCRLGWRSLL